MAPSARRFVKQNLTFHSERKNAIHFIPQFTILLMYNFFIWFRRKYFSEFEARPVFKIFARRMTVYLNLFGRGLCVYVVRESWRADICV